MTITERSPLIRILAMQDAIFTPVRNFNTSVPSTVYTLRKEYDVFGHPWKSYAKDPTVQKRLIRELYDLEESGLIKLLSSTGGKTTAVRLTEDGEWQTRKACDLCNLDDTLSCLDHIASLIDAGKFVEHNGQKLVSECTIQRVSYSSPKAGEKFSTLQDFLFPALRRGWITSRTSTTQQVFYTLTNAGREKLEASKPLTNKRASFTGTREALHAYDKFYKRSLDQLRSMVSPDPQEIGELPLPPLRVPAVAG